MTEQGLFRSVDNGESWIKIETGLPDSLLTSLNINTKGHIFVFAENNYYSGAPSGGISRSTDNGVSWINVSDKLKDIRVQSLVIDSNDQIFIATDLEGIFLSNDNGDNWKEINSNLPTMKNERISKNKIYGIDKIVFDSKGYLYVALVNSWWFANSGIYRSIDNGANWQRVLPAVSDIYCFGMDFNGHIKAYVTTGGTAEITGYISTDHGENWKKVGSEKDIIEVDFGEICEEEYFLPKFVINSKGEIYSGNKRGVFRSLDRGRSWEAINEGISELTITSLAINPEGYILVGTNEGNIFHSRHSTVLKNK